MMADICDNNIKVLNRQAVPQRRGADGGEKLK